MRPILVSIALATTTMHVASIVQAQSAQLNSMQLSATALAISTSYVVPGGEIQYRRTLNAWSVGLGLQSFYDPTTYCRSAQSCHTIGLSSVGFAEPRFIVRTFAADRAASYLAGRVAYSFASQRDGLLFGGGGGVITTLRGTTALDLGTQLYKSGSTQGIVYQLRAGLSVGF
jgi:hypothetical protein